MLSQHGAIRQWHRPMSPPLWPAIRLVNCELHSSIRVPNGPLEDSFYLAQGRQFWDASLIYSPTLILRSQLDFWSRPEDVTRLKQQLLHAPRVRAIEIPNGTHYVLLERAEKGRKQLLEEILSFLENKSHGEAIATPDTSTMVR
jgi:pimeloyl-ACP methyl ester carboxylesterase